MMRLPVPACIDRGRGATAVFLLHGIGGGKQAWPAQLDAIAGAGYRVVAWDMPGYGASEMLDPYDWPGIASALERLIDHIGAERNVIVGHSLGGMVALEAMAHFPAKIHGLVLVGTSPAFGRSEGSFQQAFVDARLKPLAEGRSMAELAAMLAPTMIGRDADPDAAASAVEVMSAVPPETYRRALHALVRFERRGVLPRIAVPTLALVGEADRNAPPAVMEKMAARIPGARFVEVPGMGHLAPMERPARFNALVLEFLEQHFAPAAVAGAPFTDPPRSQSCQPSRA